MNQKIIIESLALDLKRVSLGLQRGSNLVANRFKEEALKRKRELESQELNDYLKNLASNTQKVLMNNDDRVAEDALMYSTLFQNYALKVGGWSDLVCTQMKELKPLTTIPDYSSKYEK